MSENRDWSNQVLQNSNMGPISAKKHKLQFRVFLFQLRESLPPPPTHLHTALLAYTYPPTYSVGGGASISQEGGREEWVGLRNFQ